MFYTNGNAALRVEPLAGSMAPCALRLQQGTVFGANGKRAIASDGKGRRFDACRIENGCVTEVFEITSPTEALRSRKVQQILRGDELINTPGTFVKGAKGQAIPFAPGIRTQVLTRP